MSAGGATAVSFALLAWVLLWWAVFELQPELRAAKLRLRLRRLQLEQEDAGMFAALDAAARHAEEFRWLSMALAPESEPAGAAARRAAEAIVRHAAWGAPWMWLSLLRAAGRERWLRRAWGLVECLQRGQTGA